MDNLKKKNLFVKENKVKKLLIGLCAILFVFFAGLSSADTTRPKASCEYLVQFKVNSSAGLKLERMRISSNSEEKSSLSAPTPVSQAQAVAAEKTLYLWRAYSMMQKLDLKKMDPPEILGSVCWEGEMPGSAKDKVHTWAVATWPGEVRDSSLFNCRGVVAWRELVNQDVGSWKSAILDDFAVKGGKEMATARHKVALNRFVPSSKVTQDGPWVTCWPTTHPKPFEAPVGWYNYNQTKWK